jgi:tripartite-type tricarboxylate transporter receptor subunit TctC
MPALRLIVCCVALVIAGAASAQTSALNWPNRPIRLIVPTGAGAATDIMARLLADGIGRGLGQPVVVENIPGASGIVAHQAVARAQPDGNTLLFTNTSGLAVNLISFKQLSYDPTRDFTAVAMVCSLGPQMLSVNAELPVQSVAELVAYAKAHPGQLSIAYDTTAGAGAFAAKLLNRRAEVGLVEVPNRSATQMVQDVAGGTVQVMRTSIAAARAVVDAGKVRRLAVTSASRFPGLPDLPSVSETIPGVVMNGWFALVAPAGTPAPVVARLNREIGEYLKGPEVQPKLLLFGLATEGAGTPETTTAFIRDEQAQWRALARELDVEPQ